MKRLLSLALLAGIGCAPSAPAHGIRAPAIYGTDDRVEYYESRDELHRRLTRESSVVLVAASDLDATDPEDVALLGADLQTAYGVCADERFADQPTAGFCSGVLIGEDLVLTAGHCFDERSLEAECAATRFVFDYWYAAEGALEPISLADDVYACDAILVIRNEILGGGREAYDHAIVQLDRPVSGARSPASVTPALAPLTAGAPLLMIGYPNGIPAKIEAGGSVFDARADTLDYFVSSNDVFAGNSGGPVFDDTGVVVGVLVAGDEDYEIDRGCRRPYTLPEESAGSWSSYAALAIEELCATGYEGAICAAAPDAGPGGPPPDDAGPDDGGTPDAASPALDAGTGSTEDGGSTSGRDAGRSHSDADVVRNDAMPPTVDATLAEDGGTSEEPPADMEGGCGCRAPSSNRALGPTTVGLFGLGLLVWRRRSGARRSSARG